MSTEPGAPPDRRTIRSYVRRTGRVTRAQSRALEELWPRYGLDAKAAFDPGAAFGRPGPLTLEIGFGMGDALVAMAAAHPERNFVGVDVYSPGIGSALSKIHARSLDNVRLVRADAVDGQRLADDVAGAQARVQRRIGVLKDDLHAPA